MMDGFLIGPYTYELAPNGETLPAYFLSPGSNLTLSVTVKGDSNSVQYPLGTPVPTGTVQICLSTYGGLYGECQYGLVTSQTASLVPLSGAYAQESVAVTTFSDLGAGPDGYYFFNAVYSGDSVWGGGSLIDISPINIQTLPPLAPTTTVLSITPTSFSSPQTATITATITGAGNPGTSPTGELDFYNNDVFLTYCFWYPQNAVTGTTTTCTFEVTPSWFNENGANQLTAKYWGDGANGPSVSDTVSFTATQTNNGDFTLAPQTPQITVQSGSTGTVGLNLQSLSNFNGAVALICATSSTQFSCGVNPASATLNGTATATLTINATVQTARIAVPIWQGQSRWPMAAGLLCFGFLLAVGRAGRKLQRSLLLSLGLLAAMAAASCGGSAPSQNQTPINGAAAGTYSVLVTGTANGIIHNAKITVVVP